MIAASILLKKKWSTFFQKI